MLQYDLTSTRLFESISIETIPTEAEVSALTVALLVIRGAAYSDLSACDFVIRMNEVEELALCIEVQLAAFTRDLGCGNQLRDRIRDFVGLRISAIDMARPRGRGTARQ